MDVHVLVYDLSRGMARQMSMGFLGFQLDAIYHTSIQLDGREYVYDGNIVSIVPGSSHLGRPEREIHLGKTELPMDVIEVYLDSLREIYTVEVGFCCIVQPAAGKRCLPNDRRTTSSSTTAITSLTTSLPSFSEEAFQTTSQICRRQFSTHPWARCSSPCSTSR